MMDWLAECVEKEKELKEYIKQLRQVVDNSQDFSKVQVLALHRSIMDRIAEIQLLIDEYLSTKKNTEKTVLQYEVRLLLPLFSHLRAIYKASEF